MKNLFRISGVILFVLSIFLIHSCKKDKPTTPIITTIAVSAITQTTATSGGNITNDGGATVTTSGVCWNTSAVPIIANNKTIESIGSGIFTSNLTQLTPNTMYYVRAYATNLAGTGYGNQVTFTTSSIATATLTTTAITSITQTGAVSGGNITSENGGSVTARGVCWSTTTNPTTALSTKTSNETGIGSFVSNLVGLLPGTMYYVRSYATNSIGTSYGSEINFTTLPATVPVLITAAITSITQTTATSGGTITSDGAASITARGVCWSTSQNPTVNDSKSADGTGTGSFTSSIIGLTLGTTYYVRAYATNSLGTSYGSQESFTTLGPPTVTTATITTITQTSATCGGNVTAAGGAAVTARGVCWSTTQNPTISDSKTLDGTGTGSFTSAITALTGNTTYYVRSYATNSVNTSYGNQTSFKSSPVLPTITTTTVSSLTATTCISGGTITNDGGANVTERGVCWSKTASPTILDSKTSNGTGSGTFTSPIAGLSAVTTYYVRAYATNSVGTAYGNEVTVTALGQAPTATTAAATSLLTTGASLNGTVNPNYLSTIVSFEYGTTISYGSMAIATQSPVTGNISVTVNTVITGLLPGTIYHFRVKAVNELGTTYGNDMTFTTLGSIPSASTTAATSIIAYGSTFNGTVNANYLSASVSFDYGLTTDYGGTATATQSPVTGNTSTNVSAVITELLPGTTYHFRVKAENSLGITYGSDMSFTTLGQNPTTTTTSATNILLVEAQLNCTVNANFLSTVVSFEYGTTISYGSMAIATQSPVTGNISVTVNTVITGLLPGTIYHFRVKAVNELGTTYGNDMTFTTAPITVNDVDGNTYNVLAIGKQVWLKENLKTTKYNENTDIPNVVGNAEWNNIYANQLTTPAYCWYNNNISNKVTLGALYNWFVVDAASNGNRNVCPTGWHVPTSEEWTKLTTYIGGEAIAGGKLKEVGTIHWTPPNIDATDETGFTALPGGFRSFNSQYDGIGFMGGWWSKSTKFLKIYHFNGFGGLDDNGKFMGYSVRCLMDN